ncbi:hypothetical protein [Acinetobacter baumannii]|uniref:hypothetical protein n=2 Tax=Acinetobacter baumannii TaxID=470 RepID=UPI000BF6581A|nr:hypothetical protein [Acinetobacter baumannii]MDC4397465.1 hypothetical protein [Acinetobacter baumannii]MDC4494580.1 hypothetical protein [Acinetobacter baumannii]MDC4649101.1 hypothetical protein [Acinetobacter baumannii]MDC4867505.1 hypothetical protein [Acinetobacter baumannii]MDC4935160.1 hypothetical protein [Acinetobacter baumannii]
MIYMRNLLKLIFSFSLLIPIGCSNRVHEQPSNKYPFEEKMKVLLGNNLEIIDSINKYEAQISYFEFTKDPGKLDKIVKYLEKDGWVLKGKGQGVDTYCLGLNNKINIVNPIFGEIKDYKGGELKITNYNVNTVLYRYYKWGDDLCE